MKRASIEENIERVDFSNLNAFQKLIILEQVLQALNYCSGCLDFEHNNVLPSNIFMPIQDKN